MFGNEGLSHACVGVSFWPQRGAVASWSVRGDVLSAGRSKPGVRVHRSDVLPRQSVRAALLKSAWRKMFPVGNAVLFKRPWLLHASLVPFAEAVARKAQSVCSRTGIGAVVASVGCAVCVSMGTKNGGYGCCYAV